jgi:hypothetical protein
MPEPTQGILYMLPMKILFRKRIPFARIEVTGVFVPTQLSLGGCLHFTRDRIQLEVLALRLHMQINRVAA